MTAWSRTEKTLTSIGLTGFGFILACLFCFLDKNITTPETCLLTAILAIHVFKRFIPKREDEYLRKINKLNDEMADIRTEISKLNLILGVNIQQANSAIKRAMGVEGVEE